MVLSSSSRDGHDPNTALPLRRSVAQAQKSVAFRPWVWVGALGSFGLGLRVWGQEGPRKGV